MHRVKMHAFAELFVIIFARGVPARRATLDGRLGEGAESTRRSRKQGARRLARHCRICFPGALYGMPTAPHASVTTAIRNIAEFTSARPELVA
jgi:hypothetical protein